MASRKAYIRTLEGALGTMLMLTFILYVLPQSGRESGIDKTTIDYSYQALKTLDNSGILQENLIIPNPNTTSVLESLNEIMPENLNYSLKITSLNSTTGQLQPVAGETSYINFTTGAFTIDKASLTLYFRNASSPTISMNSTTLFSSSDTLDTPIRIDLTRHLNESENSVTITTSNDCKINYLLNLHETKSTPYIPINRAAGSVTYMLAGNTTAYLPTTITLYLWER